MQKLSWIIFRFNHPLNNNYLLHRRRKWRNDYLSENRGNRVTFETTKFGRGLGVRKVKNCGAGCKFPPVGNSCGAGTEEGDRLLVGGKGRGQRPEALHREIEPRSFFFSTYSSLSLSLSLPLSFSSSLPGPHPVHPSPSILWTRTFFFLSVSFLLAAAAAADAQPVLHRRIDPIECVSEERGWF